MKLGISSWSFPWAIGVPGYPPEQPLTAFGLLDRAADLGVHVVQIADNLPLAALTPSTLERLAHHAADREICIEVGTRGIGPDNLRTYLRLAQQFGSPLLRVVIDTADHHPSPEEVVTSLGRLMPEFEQAAVCLAVENHDRFKARTLAGILERIGSRTVGVCLDTVNSFGALEGPEAVVAALAPWVVNLHVKDFTVVRARGNLGFIVEGRPAGQGMLDVPWLLARMPQGCQVNAILEQWPPPEPELADTIVKESRWVEQSVQYLRTFIPT